MSWINKAGVSLAVLSACIALDARTNPAQAQSASSVSQLDEIIVTAQRREQRLQDVPLAVTALGQEALEVRGINDFESYLRQLPSASFVDAGSQGSEVKMRGVGSGNSGVSPTTAVYLGDVPLVHTGRSVSSVYNFSLVDIARVEVLRGPQGQLYGSNSLGGAIKNVPNDPVFDGFHWAGSVGAGETRNAGSNNYDADLTFNIPLSDEFAIRVTGYASQQGGYYKNVFAGGPALSTLIRGSTYPAPAPGGALGININGGPPGTISNRAIGTYRAPAVRESGDNKTSGARLIAKWAPTDAFDAKLVLAYEKKEGEGPRWAMNIIDRPGAALGLPPAPIGPKVIAGPAPFTYLNTSNARNYEYSSGTPTFNEDEMFLANVVLNYDFGWASLSSSTSYWDRTEKLATPLGVVGGGATGFVIDAFPLHVDRFDNPTAFTQEVRLTSPSGQRLTWLGGVFYQELEQHYSFIIIDDSGLDINYIDTYNKAFLTRQPLPTTRVPSDEDGTFIDKQTAVFGEIAYDILSNLNVAVSARAFKLDQSLSRDAIGFSFVGQGHFEAKNSDTVFTPKVNINWKAAPGKLIYFTAAEGFRTGAVNRAAPRTGANSCVTNLAALGYPGADSAPPTEADTLWNYEIGAKTTWYDGRLTANAAIYRIDWQNLQNRIILTNVTGGNTSCTTDQLLNIGDAVIQGAEVELRFRATDDLILEASGSWVDAQYDTPYPALKIRKGDTIEGTPEKQFFVAAQYGLNVMNRTAWVRGEYSYTGETSDIPADFLTQPKPFQSGDFTQINVRAGIDLTDNFTLDGFVNNVFDTYGVTKQTDIGGGSNPIAYTIRPRTYGLKLRANF